MAMVLTEGVSTPVPTIRPGTTEIVPFVVKSRYHMNIEDIPSTILVVLKRKDGFEIAHTAFRTDMSEFVSALGAPIFDPNKFSVSQFNILLFGPKGAGKSAFINSVHAMTQSYSDGEAMKSFVPVHGGKDHCTVHYNKIGGLIDLPFAFWDTWGVSEERYNGNELEMIMKGQLPEGWEMDAEIKLTTTVEEATAWDNQPHAVIFLACRWSPMKKVTA